MTDSGLGRNDGGAAGPDRPRLGAGRVKPNDIDRLFRRRPALIGMIHLLPLPGAPRFRELTGVEAVYERALREGKLLEAAGFDGVMVENGGDVPFVPPDAVGHETTAALSVATDLLHRELKIPVGVNCLA